MYLIKEPVICDNTNSGLGIGLYSFLLYTFQKKEKVNDLLIEPYNILNINFYKNLTFVNKKIYENLVLNLIKESPTFFKRLKEYPTFKPDFNPLDLVIKKKARKIIEQNTNTNLKEAFKDVDAISCIIKDKILKELTTREKQMVFVNIEKANSIYFKFNKK